MTDKPENPPAFSLTFGPDATRIHGMDLRDWFAGMALQGLCAFPGQLRDSRRPDAKLHARMAYEYADAMLAERGRK